MPNRYEREIEEILSRMEESEPRRAFGDRIRPMKRPPSRARSLPSFHFPFVHVLMLVSILLVLVATGITYFEGSANLVTGIIGSIGLVLFVVALVVGWRDRFRPHKKAQWRSPSYVEVTPIRQNPISMLMTRIRVFRLRMQYRRAQRDNGEL
jgi:hypothetical protein